MKTIKPPGHILAARIMGKPIDFEWVNDDVADYIEKSSRQIMRLLAPISLKGRLALAAGLTEWIIWRLDGLGEFGDAALFVEAVWAGIPDLRYVDEWWLDKAQETSGAGLSARLEAVRILDEGLADIRRLSSVSDCTRHLAFLAQHILKGNKSYNDWLKEAARRVAVLSPMSERTRALFRDEFELEEDDDVSEHYGHPVARAMLDTTIPFAPGRNAELIDEFLRSLDPSKNRYLIPAKQLRAGGFEGTPYRFPPQ